LERLLALSKNKKKLLLSLFSRPLSEKELERRQKEKEKKSTLLELINYSSSYRLAQTRIVYKFEIKEEKEEA
jgi:hypothetical protein